MYRNILLAIDVEDEEEAERALCEGIRLLGEGGSLHLATVFDPGGASFFPHVATDASEDIEQRARDSLSALAEKHLAFNSGATLHVLAGSPGEKLVALAASIEADLILLVSRGAGGRWPLRRATVECVAVSAPCAVLVLPAPVKKPQEGGES